MKDIYFNLDKPEIMSNAQENAQIELTKAQKESVRINTLLNLASQLDNETLMQQICEVLDIDYEEIKNKLSEQSDDISAAEQELDGISDGESESQQQVLEMLDSLLEELS